MRAEMLPPRCAPSFSDVVSSELLRSLDDEPGAAWIMDRDGRLAFANRAWFHFAADNDGGALATHSPVGMSLWSAVPDVLRPFYDEAWSRVFDGGQAWQHEYECSSPSRRRRFVMRVVPLAARRLAAVTNTLIDEGAPPAASGSNLSVYADDDGLVAQCAHCRRVRRRGGAESWDWVPALVSGRAARITHGLCATCLELHYGPEVDGG